MILFLCVDDTDDLTKATSTGEIAQMIAKALEALGGRMHRGITRHQLLLDERIKYTSHNSAMCMELEFDRVRAEEILAVSEGIIRAHCASSSNPGLALSAVRSEELIEFGFSAKRRVIARQEAEALARRLEGVWLRGLGGDGSGMIGALAGIGLRMSGCDGSFRGKQGGALQGQVMRCDALCREIGADYAVDAGKEQVRPDARAVIVDTAKLFLVDGYVAALARMGESGVYELATKEEGRSWMDGTAYCCERFLTDNDENEYAQTVLRSCFNCLYRRWIADGFRCVLP